MELSEKEIAAHNIEAVSASLLYARYLLVTETREVYLHNYCQLVAVLEQRLAILSMANIDRSTLSLTK